MSAYSDSTPTHTQYWDKLAFPSAEGKRLDNDCEGISKRQRYGTHVQGIPCNGQNRDVEKTSEPREKHNVVIRGLQKAADKHEEEIISCQLLCFGGKAGAMHLP